MKKSLILFFFLFLSVAVFAQKKDSVQLKRTRFEPPTEINGFKVRYATLSKGRYQEFFSNDTIQQIGSVLFNRVTGEVVGEVVKDSLYFPADVVSRWWSIDPLAEKFPEQSPYNFTNNNPINAIDPDGREVYFLNGDDATKVIEDLNAIFRKTYGLKYDVFKIEQREVSVTKTVVEKADFDLFNPDTWDGEVEKQVQGKEMRSYIKTDNEGGFDWDKNKYTEAVFDVLNSTEVVLKGDVVPSETPMPRIDDAIGGKMREYGGGFSFKKSRTFWIDNNPKKGSVGGWTLHETIHHFYSPIGNNESSDELQKHFGLPLSNPHGGKVTTNWSDKEIQRLKRLRQKNK
jgi:hypothetical protein